jgi:predicted ester cyclase
VLAPGYVRRFDTDGVLDRAQCLEAVGVFYRAFPDLIYRIEDLIAEGDRVVVRYVARGTHTGDFFGHPPPAKR